MKTYHKKNSLKKYQDIDAWLITGYPEFNMNDDEIVQSMLYDSNNTPSLKEIDEPDKRIFFDTAYLALQTNLSFFFRETADVTLGELMMVMGEILKLICFDSAPPLPS